MEEGNEPAWVTYEQVIAIHSRQLRRFGGAPGLRDDGLLRSAIERPANKWHYEQAGLAELAAAYAFGLAKNHAFVDGNKRVAFIAAVGFLERNGLSFTASEEEATIAMLRVAEGSMTEKQFARWLGESTESK